MHTDALLDMMSSYLDGDEAAGLQLADVFEERGFHNAAKILRGQLPQWLGSVGISRGEPGPRIWFSHLKEPVADIDTREDEISIQFYEQRSQEAVATVLVDDSGKLKVRPK